MKSISFKMFQKELCLSQSVLTPLFLLGTAMTFIPNYPILVGAFMVCLGIFYSFQNAREQQDILYSILLPVGKRDIVSAKYRFVCFYQIIAFLLFSVFTVLRMTLLSGSPVYQSNTLLLASPLFLAFVLLIFLWFNVFFVGGFMKTAYALGKPLIFFSVAAFLTVGIAETLPHLPGMEFLKNTRGEKLGLQFSFLAGAVLLFAGGTLLSLKKAADNFEKVDL